MASDSNSGIVAIVAILMIVLVGGFVAWQAGVFNSGGGGHSTTHKIDVNVK